MEEAIETLTRLLIKAHIENDETIYRIKKKDLYRICIKMLKIIDTNK